MVPSSHFNTNSKASHVYDLPCQGYLRKMWEMGGQAFVVVPVLDVSTSQNICEVDNMLHRGYLPEVSKNQRPSGSGGPTLDVSIGERMQ